MILDPLAGTIDPAEAGGSVIQGEGRPLRPVPVFQRGTVGLAVVVIGDQLSDERTDVSRSAPIGDEVQTDSLRRTKKTGEPAKGFSEYAHDSTSPKDVKGKVAGGTLPPERQFERCTSVSRAIDSVVINVRVPILSAST